MDARSGARRALKWSAVTLAALFGLLVLLVAAVALTDPNRLRAPLARFIAVRSGREIRFEGPFHAHLWSRTPELSAERVTIGNPPWMPPGPTAEIGRVSLLLELRPLLSRALVIRRLELKSVSLHLQRDATGRANWQWVDPTRRLGKGPPLMHSLSMPEAHVTLEDARRHLQFDGIVSVREQAGPGGGPPPLRIDGAGQLNGRAVTLAVNADALANARRDRPYRFAFLERSSGSRVEGRGFLPRPFDFHYLQTRFDAEGEDLKDLYFLTGLGLFDTGRYRISGELAREATHFEFKDLVGHAGASDVSGTLSVESAVARRAQLDAQLSSQRLRLADLGPRAAGREPATPAKTDMLPARPLPLTGLRKSDWTIAYQAHALEAGREMLHAVAVRVRLEHGILTLDPASAELEAGRLSARLRLDASHDLPNAQLDARIADLPLEQFRRGRDGQPPLKGQLDARIDVKGQGRTLRELGASAEGSVTAVLPRGEIRASLADLAGIDLQRGLGVALSKDHKETGLRCAVASFDIHAGTATARTLVIDTDPTVITGQGMIHFDSDSLDFTLQGHPKHLSVLRVRSPVLIRGTLTHPSISIAPRNALAQAGAAIALGVVATPLAAALAFVDPGLATDANCTGLMSDARAEGAALEHQRSRPQGEAGATDATASAL
jgi:uncharacterized protein involved in outer membrane biogenesis